jgi:23S rRNA U2552 (ribose-2'-O)-methylase RlmE/FtsJ
VLKLKIINRKNTVALPILNRIFTKKPSLLDESNQEESMLVVSDQDAPAYIVKNLEQASNELEKIYYSHQGRRILKWHHYLALYDRHLQSYKNRALEGGKNSVSTGIDGRLRILEIGVQNGGSLQMWRRYFGAAAVIFGIDIDPRCKEFEEDGCKIRIGDQSDPSFLNSVIDEMGGVDIVIDDGSHIASHQFASFNVLFPLLAQDGIYICEDLHTSYWDDWEGGYKRTGTFIEFTKDIIDHMHEWYFHNTSTLDDLNLKKSVLGVSVYDSVVVIEKGNKARPYAVHVGNNSF